MFESMGPGWMHTWIGIGSAPFVFLMLWIDKDPIRKKKEEAKEPAKVRRGKTISLWIMISLWLYNIGKPQRNCFAPPKQPKLKLKAAIKLPVFLLVIMLSFRRSRSHP
eukprot:COSAG06_NODE_11787_length_1464_cov_17.339194_1_plen_108_part_00